MEISMDCPELLLARLSTGIDDPRILLAMEICQSQLSEPPLSLRQLQEVLALLRPGRRPCARTIQRWVKEKGFPCSFDEISEKRVYHLSACLEWLNHHSISISIVQSATDAADQGIRRQVRHSLRGLRASA